jgi:rod shape-determining protein MreB and related proteins
MLGKKLGIDLGTANSVVYVQGKGVVLVEPTVVALDVADMRVIAVGNEAKEMIGKTPDEIVVRRPLKSGVIADARVTEALLKYFFNKAIGGTSRFFKPDVMISVPAGITSVERRAVLKAATQAGARKIDLVYEPLLAAIGAGLPIETSSGNMIVNMGGGTCEIAVISLRGIVEYSSLRIAGDALNEAIIAYLRRKHGLLIGEQTAEMIKIKVGSAIHVDNPKSIEIKGRDAAGGMPRSMVINSNEVAEALRMPLNQIIGAIKSVLERTPPELAADIIDRGMVMSGGTSMLTNLDKLFTRATGVPAHVADEPIFCVAKGTGVALELYANGRVTLPRN